MQNYKIYFILHHFEYKIIILLTNYIPSNVILLYFLLLVLDLLCLKTKQFF